MLSGTSLWLRPTSSRPTYPRITFDAVVALGVVSPHAVAGSGRQDSRGPQARRQAGRPWRVDNIGKRDFLWNLRSALLNKRLQKALGPDAMDAPATLDRTSWRETRAWCEQNLPGATLKRHLLWRYTLQWDKPAG